MSETGRVSSSLPASFFEELYTKNEDPWDFEKSQYEASKYSATLEALPHKVYRSAFEIGCSIGVLSKRLASRCEALLAVDVSEKALARAQARCKDLDNVKFQIMQVPQEYPEIKFDLTLLSEVGYFWSWNDLELARQKIIDRLAPGGNLLLVHWTPFVAEFPLTGDQVHDYFLSQSSNSLQHVFGNREERYRLDLFERL